MTAVIAPSLGLYFNTTSLGLDPRAVRSGMNFRIKNGVLSNLNLGWERFSDFTLNGMVMFIDNFFPRGAGEFLMFGTPSDIYYYDASADAVVYLTPQYSVGTAETNGVNVTGAGGTLWVTNDIGPGDQITFGTAGVNDPLATWFTVATVGAAETAMTLTASAGIIAAGPYTIRKTFNGDEGNQWDIDTFVMDGDSGDDLWFATNGVDPVITWNGDDDTVTLHDDLGFTCTTLAVYANQMIYGNVTSGDSFPTSIINSDAGLPLHAGALGTGISEQFRVHDGTDRISNLIPLGDNLVIYSDRHLVLAQFVGDPLVFIFRVAASGLGPIGPDAIADFGDFHEFVGADAMYSFDGVGVQEVNAHVWRDIIRQADPIRRQKIFGHFDEENGDLIWSVPSTTDAGSGDENAPPEVAWSEHYLEEVPPNTDTPYSKRAFPFTASGFYERAEGLTWANALGNWADYNFSWNDQFFALAFPQNLVGDDNGKIYILNETQTGDGELLPSFVRTGRQVMVDGRNRGLLKRVYPFAQKLAQTLDVEVFLADHASGPSVSGGVFEFDTLLPEGAHFVSPFRRARFYELQYGSAGLGWALEGWDTDIVKGGNR